MRYLAAVLAILASSPAMAQFPRRDALIQDFRNCALVASLGISGEKNMVAEQAFVACRTEEQALRAWFALVSVNPAIANSFVIRVKMDVKRIILSDPIVR